MRKVGVLRFAGLLARIGGGLTARSCERLSRQIVDGMPVLRNQFQPCQWSHLREVDTPKTHSCDEDVDAITQWLVTKRIDSLCHCLRAVRTIPAVFHLCMSLCDGHLQRRVSHFKRYELLPVFRPRQTPRDFKSFVKRRRRQGCKQAEDGQPW